MVDIFDFGTARRVSQETKKAGGWFISHLSFMLGRVTHTPTSVRTFFLVSKSRLQILSFFLVWSLFYWRFLLKRKLPGQKAYLHIYRYSASTDWQFNCLTILYWLQTKPLIIAKITYKWKMVNVCQRHVNN